MGREIACLLEDNEQVGKVFWCNNKLSFTPKPLYIGNHSSTVCGWVKLGGKYRVDDFKLYGVLASNRGFALVCIQSALRYKEIQ